VTGQLSSSLFIMAFRLAVLKSLHRVGDPVIATVTPSPLRARSGPLRSSAARTISFVFAVAAPAWDERGATVGGHRHTVLRCHDHRHTGVGLEESHRLVEHALAMTGHDRSGVGVHDNL